MSEPIVVGVDPVRADAGPLEFGRAMARSCGAPLIAVGVFRHEPVTDALSDGTLEHGLHDETRRRLRAVAAASGAELVVRGASSPARALHEAAGELGAGLLVVGSTRRGKLGRLLAGSTAQQLLHGAPCPVAVTPVGYTAGESFARIGVGYADRDDARAVLAGAGALARRIGASLHVRNVIEPIDFADGAVLPGVALEWDADEERERAKASIHDAIAHADMPADVWVDAQIGDPAARLIELSRDVDVLVCGSRGYGPHRAVLLGGVTHYLVHEARCPVIVVPRASTDVFGTLTQASALGAGGA